MSGDIPFGFGQPRDRDDESGNSGASGSGSGGSIPPGFGSGNLPALALADQKGLTWRTWAQHSSSSAQCCSPPVAKTRARSTGEMATDVALQGDR